MSPLGRCVKTTKGIMHMKANNNGRRNDEALRRETEKYLQLGPNETYDRECGCVLVRTSDGELVEDYDLCAYLD